MQPVHLRVSNDGLLSCGYYTWVLSRCANANVSHTTDPKEVTCEHCLKAIKESKKKK